MTDFVSGLRQAIQDLLIPEFRSLQTEVRNLSDRLDRHAADNAQQFQAIHERFERVDQRFESLTREMNERFNRVDQRFDRVDERFERVDERFERVDQEILGLNKTVASMNGKLDILIEHIVDYKEVARLSARQDQLEKRLGEVDATLGRILARLSP